MKGYPNYIPRGDYQFLEWVKFLIAYVIVNILRFRVPAPSEEFQSLAALFESALKKCTDANHGKVDTSDKNAKRKALEKECRTYIQGYIAKNPLVNDIDKERMKLPIYDTVHTRIGAPVGQADARVVYHGGQILELLIEHVAGTEFDERANYGYRIYYDVAGAGEPQPEHGSQLTKSRFTHHKKERFQFEFEDARKTAYFSIRYENGKGEAGPWGPLVKADIPSL